ncbi:MAG: RNA-binding transcriptional accessory protein [Prevotellaceae bacterium]|jgi:uncharacterized protein|nr:RNA-binding transcriptional accessory protein [Prevotellaceae bacterium]
MNLLQLQKHIAIELQLSEKQVINTIKLLTDGATIPFISRYRKEMTDGLDEVKVGEISELYDKLLDLERRKETVVKTIDEQGKMTDELRERIDNCLNANELEDLYLPFKPKRRTRAEIAREKGLEPLAKMIMSQNDGNVEQMARRFVNEKVASIEEAVHGAQDIIAEWVNESESARTVIRKIFAYQGVITSKIIKGKEEEAQKYRDYFDVSEKLTRCSSHRLLAMRRGEAEGFLRVSISPSDDEYCMERLEQIFVRKRSTESSLIVHQAVKDGYKRLLKPSIETEFAAESKEKADREAIRVFTENLTQLLLEPPLGQQRVLAIDPGFRTGCKMVALDAQGCLLYNETIYPHPPQNEYARAQSKLRKMVEQYDIQVIAIGNGTASRETEHFIKNTRYDRAVKVFVVSEKGASVYSASKIAREEFPDYDVTVRGAVSIGRRLMDPLAELVKIEPKAIGVGQYQHDVDQTALKKSLDRTVENAVNKVGVDLNTASKHLLTYISGLGATLAQNIVNYRTDNGAFTGRKQLLKVPKMGAKTFEQAAGFLRITDADNPLDNSNVHPESYPIVEKMAKHLNIDVKNLIGNKEFLQKIDLRQFITDKTGLPTLTDIITELEKPGRDPRKSVKILEFDDKVKNITDLKTGMELPAIIINITDFGAFADIGIKENGLIHKSQLSETYITNPSDVVSLHQHVKVSVLEVDIERKRIQLKLIEK